MLIDNLNHQKRKMELDAEQVDLFIKFVEFYKDIIRDKRFKFVASHLADGQTIIGHPLKSGKDFKLYKIDFEALLYSGLFQGHYIESIHSMEFIIPLEAIKFYGQFKEELYSPVRNIENNILDYLKAEHFSKRYPATYKKWQAASEFLKKSNASDHLTTIGHLCREVLQEFSDELVALTLTPGKFEKSKTITKIKAVLDNQPRLRNGTTKEFLSAILQYWGTVSDLVQKQEHDAQSEKEILTLEDAKRIVFHTMIIMYEFDRTIT